MRCKLCTTPALYAPLRFCGKHFLAYYEKKVRHYFESTHVRNTKVLIAVSGGKDSAALADILVRIQAEFGLEIGLFTINLNIPEYSEKGLEKVRQVAGHVKELAKQEDIPFIIEDLKNYNRIIPDFADNKKPCGPCGTMKRYLLNKAAVEHGYDYLATGHNLDDEFYFAMHNLLHGNIGQLRRSAKILPPKPELKLAGRLKPLSYLTEKENRLYCLLQGIPHDADECPFSVDNPQLAFKEKFAHLPRDEKRNLLKSLRELQQSTEKTETGEEAGQIHPCPHCHYPTTSNAECVFCKIVAGKRKN